MRNLILALGVAPLLAVCSLAAAEPTAKTRETYPLESKRAAGTVDRVEVVLEAGGDLLPGDMTNGGAAKPSPVKMKAVANLTYEEKSLEVPIKAGGILRSVRHYDKAEATIHVGGDDIRPTLRDQRRTIAVEIDGGEATLFSPAGMLTREELDLLDLPGNSLLLERLLPGKPVALNDTWKHPDAVLAALCGLDAVSSNAAESVLRLVSDGVARIEMSGTVAGTADGASTSIEVKAKYRFDTKSGRVTWFGLVTQEKRPPGAVGPGLDVAARLQIKVAPGEKPVHLADAALKDLKPVPTEESKQLQFLSREAGWELAHDRRWIVIQERKDTVVLRMVDEGDYVGQCNISAASRPPEGKEVTLSAFQDDVRQSLGKSFGQLVRAGQSHSDADYRVYRVVIQGEVAQMPIQWVYYRLADRSGRQVILAFTVKGEYVDRFARADEELVRSLRISEPRVAAKPVPVAAGDVPDKPKPASEPGSAAKPEGSKNRRGAEPQKKD